MGARLKVFLVFALLWFVFIGIAYGIFYALLWAGYIPPGSGYYWVLAIMVPVLLLFNIITYFFSDRMVLSAYEARIVDERSAPRLARTVQRIATQANLPMPRLAIVPSQTPNAFATGRDPEHAVVAVTEGLLNTLDDEEMEGVIGHEMAHVQNRDILVMTVVSSAAAIISIIARVVIYQAMFGGRRQNVNPLVLLGAAITAPIAAMLVQFAISRNREYKADRVGARTTMKPLALARALSRLESANERRPMRFGHSSPAHSSLFIVKPLSGGTFVSLFSTHPPVKERIRRLQRMAEKEGYVR
ncbi:MAG: protease [Euryarchaeota archaeon]|nr:protease [Euryarchaeota archaeon]